MTTIFEFFSDLFGFGDSTADAAQSLQDMQAQEMQRAAEGSAHAMNPYENPGQDLIVDEIAFDIDHGLGIANPDELQAGATDDGGVNDWMNDDSSSNDWMEADSYDDDTSWMDDTDNYDDSSWMDGGGCDDSWMDSGCDDFGGFGDF